MILRWIIGVFFVLNAFVYFTKSPMAFIGFLLLSFLLIPSIGEWLQDKLNYSLSAKTKIIIGALLFFLTVLSIPITEPQGLSITSKLKNEQSNEVKDVTGNSFLTPTQGITVILKPTVTQRVSAYYPVLKVIDGDTIDVKIDEKMERLRLIGIDTPEAVDYKKTVQCFGEEASAKARELLNGKKVRLEADRTQGERDKYGRLLRYVFLQDGTNFNEFMIKEGYAHEYTYKGNPYKYQQQFIDAQREARENKKGLWADGACSTVPTRKFSTQP